MKGRIFNWVDRAIRLPTLGMDISDRSIKYLRCMIGKDVRFEIYGEVDVPEGVIAGGEIVREEEVTRILADLARREEKYFRSSGVVACLPEEKSFLRALSLQKVKPEDVGNAIRWEIEAEIPLPLADVAFDYEIISADADHLGVVLTAFPRVIVESYVRVLTRAGLRPVTLELESQAMVRALIPHTSENHARIIVDMGHTRTSFIIVAGRNIVFTTTIAVGGELLEEHISKALGVDRAEAALIKKENGLAKHAYDGKTFGAMIPVLDALADELTRIMESYQRHVAHTHGGDADITEIILSGGDANLLGLDTYLASATHIPVALADPFAAIAGALGGAVPPIPKNEALAFSAAIGLALRGSADS